VDRVTDLADPCRCKSGTRAGQCLHVAAEGSEFCPLHAGVNRAPARDLRQYLLAKAEDRTRLAQLDENEGLKSLQDEVKIAVGMLERRINLLQDDADFIRSCGQLNMLLLTIERLKKSSQVLEERSGAMVSRSAILRLGQQICQVIVDRLVGVPNYEQLVDTIILDIIATIQHGDKAGVPVTRVLPALIEQECH